MDHNEEYHDPDYPEVPVCVKEEIPNLSEDEKIERIKQIVSREFRKELNVREDEVTLIDQRMTTARRYLHQLRYALVSNYYKEQKLQISSSQIEDEVAAQSEPRARAEVASILRDSQHSLHPSVRKLLGKQTVNIEEIFRSRAPRNKTRIDYSAMLQPKNIKVSADSTKTPGRSIEEPVKSEEEEPGSSRPKKVPKHLDPKVDNVVTLDGVTRNKQKQRYRIIIGNTSKYMPPASRADRSTHKWLLYVRGPPLHPDVSRVITAVTVRLHHSYAPHHIVVIDKPPFQLSRRGWGEFPARLTLDFVMPHCNRPATLTHTIKLDRNYTGLQTLGAETVVDVWLYSTSEMLEFEYKTDIDPISNPDEQTDEPIKTIKSDPDTEASETKEQQTDEWLNFFTNTTEVNVDEMFVKNVKQEKDQEEEIEPKPESKVDTKIKNTHQHAITNGVHDDNKHNVDIKTNEANNCEKRIVKYMDPNTGKIYYLEMDRALDLNKIQEIVINSQGQMKTAKVSPVKTNGLRFVRKKKGISLLKPEVKNQLKTESKLESVVIGNEFDHIKNDHCYLGTDWCVQTPQKPKLEKDNALDLFHNLKLTVAKLSCPRMTVSYLLKKVPLISSDTRDPSFVQEFPFVVESEHKYWKLDFAKRRNIEWSRAKLINKMLHEKFKDDPNKVWRTKQILIYSRLHGFYPIRPETVQKEPKKEMETNEWSSWNDLENSRKFESNIRELYPTSSDLCSLSVFKSDNFVPHNNVDTLDLCDSDEDIDVTSDHIPVKVKTEVLSDSEDSLTVLPVPSEDRLRFFYIEKKCADIGIELRNEDVGDGYSYSAVHCVLLSAMKSFAEELIRAGLADQLSFSNDPQLPIVWLGSTARTALRLEHAYSAARTAPRLRTLGAAGLAVESVRTHAL